MQDLGVLPGGDASESTGISADGFVILGQGYGTNGYRAFLWNATASWQDLGVAPGDSNSSASALSADGLAMTGGGGSYYGARPIRWTAERGMHGIGLPAAHTSWRAHAISAHGTVIVGATSITPDPREPFLWTESLGPLLLAPYLESLGVDLSAWQLEEACAVSYDGSAMAGVGIFNGHARAWFVTGLFKKSDYNHDGFVDGIDYDMFMNDFETAQPGVQIRADVNFDWVVDGLDYDKFMSDFEAGR